MKKRLPFILCLLAGLAVLIGTGFVFRADQADHLHSQQTLVRRELMDLKNATVQTVLRKTTLVNGLESVIRIHPNLSPHEFVILMQGMLDGLSDVRCVRLVRRDKVTHCFPMKSRDERVEYPGNTPLRAALERVTMVDYSMWHQGAPGIMTIFKPIRVVDDDGGYRLWGLAEVDIDIRGFMKRAGLPGQFTDVLFALRVPDSEKTHKRVLAGDPVVFDMAPLSADISFFSQNWELAAVPVKGWTRSPRGSAIVLGGILLSLLAMASFWVTLSVVRGRYEDRERYRYLVHTAKTIILRVGLSGEVEFSNEYAEHFYGFEHGELIGKQLVGTLIPEKDLEGQSMKRYVTRLLTNPSAHPFNETVNMRKNGETVWVAWANQPVYASDGKTLVGLLCVGTDITDRKLMEEALRQREKQYRLLAENVSDTIWGLDADMRYTYVSPSDEVLRGYKRYEVLGLSIGEFLTPASRNRLTDLMATLEMGKSNQAVPPSATEDLEFLCADGSTVWLESRLGLMLNDDGDCIGIQGVSRDITDRKRAEALREDMERMAKHDLKTPLGAVIGLPGEIRQAGAVTPEQDSLLQTIERAGAAMLSLINRSLDLYKMECGNFILHRTPVDVVLVIERIKDEAKTLISKKGISIGIERVGPEDAQPFVVPADAGLFQSMLSNILLNAFEHSPESGAVSIILRREDTFSITIRNKGEVPLEMRDLVFEKYATSDTTSGSGLGTYSARLIARTHGGDITMDTSRPGETGVVISLPIQG